MDGFARPASQAVSHRGYVRMNSENNPASDVRVYDKEGRLVRTEPPLGFTSWLAFRKALHNCNLARDGIGTVGYDGRDCSRANTDDYAWLDQDSGLRDRQADCDATR